MPRGAKEIPELAISPLGAALEAPPLWGGQRGGRVWQCFLDAPASKAQQKTPDTQDVLAGDGVCCHSPRRNVGAASATTKISIFRVAVKQKVTHIYSL